jgi:hypothetical protein
LHVSTPEADLELRIRRWDTIGVVVSTACVVHCVALPLALALLPAIGVSFLAEGAFHQVLAVLVLLVAGLAFVPGYRAHHRRHIPLIGAVGTVLLAGAAFAPRLGLLAESTITALGGSVLVLAHVLNRRAVGHAHDHAH